MINGFTETWHKLNFLHPSLPFLSPSLFLPPSFSPPLCSVLHRDNHSSQLESLTSNTQQTIVTGKMPGQNLKKPGSSTKSEVNILFYSFFFIHSFIFIHLRQTCFFFCNYLVSWNQLYSASIVVNWCHLGTVIKTLTDPLMDHCKVYSNCFPQGYTHTHTYSTPLHIVLTPLAGNDIQPSSAVAVLVSITVSVGWKEKQTGRNRWKKGSCR